MAPAEENELVSLRRRLFGSGCLFPASDFARRALLDSASRVFAACGPCASFSNKYSPLCACYCIASTLVDSKFGGVSSLHSYKFGVLDGGMEGIGETPNPFGALGEDGLAYRQYKREGGSESYFSVAYSDDHYTPKITQALKSRPFWFGKLLARRLFGVLTYPYDWGIEQLRCIMIRIAKRLFTLVYFSVGSLGSGFDVD
jgi:hypothetical protein